MGYLLFWFCVKCNDSSRINEDFNQEPLLPVSCLDQPDAVDTQAVPMAPTAARGASRAWEVRWGSAASRQAPETLGGG